MSCVDCNDNCRQGRDCPNRKPVEFKVVLQAVYLYFAERIKYLEWIVCLIAGLYLLNLVTQ